MSEFCPRCNAVRAMTVTVSTWKKGLSEKKPREKVTRTLHCEACHAFVRSEDKRSERRTEA